MAEPMAFGVMAEATVGLVLELKWWFVDLVLV
jgi:hypothetical protein